ncbi:MAG: phage Gp37/Gp68 family protein [Haliangiales bacterium]
MAETSKIEWTDATWNPITGCSLVSEGCRHCYAARLAATRLREHPSRAGLARLNAAGEAKFTGEVRFNEQWLDQPLRWRRPRRIFVCAHGDLFHEAVPDEWIDRVFAVMALSPRHVFQVLTKRPERAWKYLSDCHENTDLFERIADRGGRIMSDGDGAHDTLLGVDWPLPNVWLGTSVENQPTADARIPHLLATPAAVRFVSAEPLLGPVALDDLLGAADEGAGEWRFSCLDNDGLGPEDDPDFGGALIDWVIVGGESGPGARPMHPDWARSLRDQCAAAGVPFFFKQWGEWGPPTPYPVPAQTGALIRHTVTASTNPKRVGATTWCAGRGPEMPSEIMDRTGNRAAGRLLDGRTHDAMPDAGWCEDPGQ